MLKGNMNSITFELMKNLNSVLHHYVIFFNRKNVFFFSFGNAAAVEAEIQWNRENQNNW